MRRAELVALVMLLLLSGCGKSPVSEAAAPKPAAPSAAPAADNQRLVQIERFDCVKAEDQQEPKDFPWAQGVSRWAAGGPGGAAWNADRLWCAVELRTGCTQGFADVELRIGGALSGARQAKIDRAGVQRVTFEVTADQWRKRFDQSSELTKRFSYRTATFSALTIASCESPEKLGPSDGPHLEFADSRHFTAGFAGGE
jgi:hypothetical protein